MHLRPIQVVISSSSIFVADWCFTLWMCHTVFTHSLAEEHLGCFQSFTVINRADINIPVQICMWRQVFISLGKMLKSDMAGSSSVCFSGTVKLWHSGFVRFASCILNFCCWVHTHIVCYCVFLWTLLLLCNNPILSLLIFLVLKSSLSDINIAIQDFHQGLHGILFTILSF